MGKKILIMFALLLLTACKEQIMHDLDESEANRMLTSLHDSNISSEKVKQANGQWAISVDKSDSIRAIKHLSDARMFKNTDGLQQQKTSLVSSKEDQKFYFERAVSRELEKTLSGMPGVLDARVHLNMPSSDPIFGNRLPDSKGTGSVLLVVAQEFSGNMSQISELIAGAAGIEKSAISILVSRDNSRSQVNSSQASDQQASVKPGIVQQGVVQPVKSDSEASVHVRNYLYIVPGLMIVALFAAALLRKVIRKKAKTKTRELGEEDLYELARDFN